MLSKEEKFAKIGKGYTLTAVEVRYAVSLCKSNEACAKYLKVSGNTWKKYANMYINPETGQTYWRDLYKKRTLYKRRISNKLEDIVEGRCPVSKTVQKFKESLIAAGYFPEQCMICGFSERRVTDFRVPLILHFIDGNRKNGKLDNLELLCYNDYFLTVGEFTANILRDERHTRDNRRSPI